MMSIETYAELKTAIANWLKGRTDLTSRIPEFIALAEDRIAQDDRIRIRAMETSADLTINDRDTALPTGFLGVRRIYLSGSPNTRLDFLAPDDYWSRHGSSNTGQPKFYTIEGENFLWGPVPDTTYTGKLLYYKRFTALSSDSDTNWLLTNARGLLLYGALVEAAPYLGNEPRLMTWAALYDDIADKLRAADRKDRHGSGLMQRSQYTVV